MVEHNTAQQRFRVTLEGQDAFLAYRLAGKEIDLYHTYVPEVFRGRGIAEQLVTAAFEHAKAEGLTVIPSCPYVSSAYLKRHAEYAPLVKR